MAKKESKPKSKPKPWDTLTIDREYVDLVRSVALSEERNVKVVAERWLKKGAASEGIKIE